ncbi:hypothetical protein ADIARSV_3477 [Arcticibacter svalbardensis MN12-7]|uniref:Uncharacterized protein n=1 Tax=Arcticibacter svalbardensis MN12-7 TaxID=1150600 RepID=R9GNU3_9SPHI|nr:hypothetical protein [Arcticibacter svalbardensis]EOR93398.1 hypothetical protein ADIARSV_3477 [Arcticibacter svalbardensis MN12-7]
MKLNGSKSIKELEEIIDRVIEQDKKTAFNSFMVEKVLLRLQGKQVVIVPLYQKALQTAAFAACILLAVSLGIFLGETYSNDKIYTHPYEITADDSQIERLDILTAQ